MNEIPEALKPLFAEMLKEAEQRNFKRHQVEQWFGPIVEKAEAGATAKIRGEMSEAASVALQRITKGEIHAVATDTVALEIIAEMLDSYHPWRSQICPFCLCTKKTNLDMGTIIGGTWYEDCLCDKWKELEALHALSWAADGTRSRFLAKMQEAARARVQSASERLGRRFQDRTFNNYKPHNDETRKALEVCRKFCATIDERLKDGSNLLMLGNVGAGKTHLAAGIVMELAESGHVAEFMNAADLIDKLRAAAMCNAEDKEQLIKSAITPSVLVLDDLGKEKPTEFVKEALFRIITTRYENMRPTVVTSNLTLGEMAERMDDPAIPSRLAEGAKILKFSGSDYRIDGIGAAQW